jgi:SAM-dependent methyltransferase
MSVFNTDYASAYDALYGSFDYDKHYNAIKSIFALSDVPISNVLDIGCGTGEFAKRLAQDGKIVVGVDPSESMLDIARSKCPFTMFYRATATSYNVNARFDAIIMMGGVLGYQESIDNVVLALRRARTHLNPGGVLVFDVWNCLAVMSQRPGERVKVVDTPDGEIIRGVSSSLDMDDSICNVNYALWRHRGNIIIKTTESHRMRYFTPTELRLFLELAGLRALRIRKFSDIDQNVDDTNWHTLVAACI